MRLIKSIVNGLLALVATISLAHATTLLPNGKQQFVDGNGAPYAGGQVYMYIPGSTSTLKNTWKDAGQVSLNTNPILLDAAGRAVIYGNGCYNQQLQDVNNVVIWTQATCATDSNIPMYGGVSGGTANAQTVTAPAFTSTDGQEICFKASATNTGLLTINPSATGALNVDRDTGAGPIATTGGEVVINNTYCVQYDASLNIFHLINSGLASGFDNHNPLSAGTVTSVGQTVDLGSFGSQVLTISGSSPNTITSFGSTATTTNPLYKLRVANSCNFTIVNSTSLIVPGAINYQVYGGDEIDLYYLGSGNWVVLHVDHVYGGNSLSKTQVVTGGPYDSNGLPTFLPATSGASSVTSQNVSVTAPLTVNFGNGIGGSGKTIISGTANTNLTWSWASTNTTVYLFVVPDGAGGLTAGTNNTTMAPIYQWGGTASFTDKQFTYIVDQNAMYIGSGGVSASLQPAVFVGQVVVDGSGHVTSSIAYAYNGQFQFKGSAIVVSSAQTTAANHNIGTSLGLIVDLGIVNLVGQGGCTVGQLTHTVSGADYFWDTVNGTITNTTTPQFISCTTPAATTISNPDWAFQLQVYRSW